MSSRYKVDILGYENDHIAWSLKSRCGQMWNGTFYIDGVTDNGNVVVNTTVTHPKNTTIPVRGMNLLNYKCKRIIINAVKNAINSHS